MDAASQIGFAYYQKLLACLRKALGEEKLGCHVDDIIIHMARCIDSGYSYFDQANSIWCDYFLKRGENE